MYSHSCIILKCVLPKMMPISTVANMQGAYILQILLRVSTTDLRNLQFFLKMA